MKISKDLIAAPSVSSLPEAPCSVTPLPATAGLGRPGTRWKALERLGHVLGGRGGRRGTRAAVGNPPGVAHSPASAAWLKAWLCGVSFEHAEPLAAPNGYGYVRSFFPLHKRHMN